MRIDLHNAEIAYAGLEVALDHPPSDGVLAAEHDRQLSQCKDARYCRGDVADHALRLARAIDRRPGVDALGARIARAVPALELTRCGDDRARPERGAMTVGNRLLVRHRQHVKARLLLRELR